MGRASVLSPRTSVLICVLMDCHRRLVCADGHTQTHTDSRGRPVCADGQPRTATDVLCVLNKQPTWAKINRTVHGKGQRAESKDQRKGQRADSKDQRADMCTDGQPRTHRRPLCADGHTRTATDVLCVLTDTHGCPVCADGHPRTSCVY
ncbi:unnamed protein product [Brassica rapa]|uniref:Uncharacterized protein n=1 Tax=Brassica campestris TaxID=3711 RepID=A0A8D9DKC7_BRACM|nr:unnamed protein product [Brassica rapa]